VQAPRFRGRRILIPLAAYLLAFGHDDRVDAAYFGVVLLVVFCGAWWLSLYAVAHGFPAGWGLLFAAVPATVTSIDRMTIDGGLAALCIGFALYAEQDAKWRTYAVLLAAALTRETGLVLVAGYVLYWLWKRGLSRALLFATTSIPALIWYAFNWVHTSSGSTELVALVPTRDTWFSAIPLKALAVRMVHPYHYQVAPAIEAALIAFDYVALLFSVLAIAVGLRMAWKREWGALEVCVYLYTLMAIFLSFQDAWTEVYGFGRILSPLLVLVGLYGLAHRKWIAVAPVLVVGARALLQLAPQALKILEGAF